MRRILSREGRHGIPWRPLFVGLGLLLASPLVPQATHDAGSAVELSEAARWLREYLRLDTSNPPGRELDAVRYLSSVLRDEGIATRTLVDAQGRASLWARLETSNPKAGALVLLHHVDVVPAGPGWAVPPFEGRIQDGRLWGRGAVDAKSLGIAHLAALVALKRSGERLTRDVVFLAVADEESGGGAGTRWLLEQRPELFEDAEAVYNEGGFNRVREGEVEWWGVEVAQKRPLWMEVVARGRGGHGSGWNPGSASHRLIEALDGLVGAAPRWRVDEPVRRFLEGLASLHDDHWRPIFADIERYVEPDGPSTGLPPGMSNLFLDSIQVTVLDAGHRINVVPSEARAKIDVRLLPDTDEELFRARIDRLLGDQVETRVILSSPRVEPSPTDTRAWRVVERVLGTSGTPVLPAFISGFTDSRYFRLHGIPTYGVSPFVLESSDLLGIHSTDERISLEAFDAGVERMTEIVREWAVAGEPP